MANYEDLLKKNKNRLNAITKQEPRKLQRSGPRRPWQENMVTQESKDIVKGSEASGTATSSAPMESHEPASKNASTAILNTTKERKQNVNNAGTNVYVNKIDYVNNAATEREQTQDNSHLNSDTSNTLKTENVNNTETNVYVNNIDYVNNAETISRPALNLDESINNKVTEKSGANFVYVNSLQTERKQNDSTETKVEKSVNSTETSLQTSKETERKQNSIYKLSRLETLILEFMFQTSITGGGRKTPPLSYDQISHAAKTTTASCKTLVARLIKKDFLIRVDFSKGPGSRTIYEIPHDAYQAFLFKNHQFLNFEVRKQNGNSTGTRAETSSQTNPSSSSSLLINNINTTTEEKQIWNEITIPEFLRTKGFSITHAKQILSDKDNTLTVEDLQESFDNFAVDLENGVMNIKSSPVVFFMGIVRKNRTKYESRFVNDQLEKEIVNYLAQQKQSESLLKDKAQMELIKKFQEWASGLSQEEKNQYVPPSNVVEEGSGAQEIMLKSYFFEKQGIKL